jgi:DNA-binding response OmpR family regulator
MTRLWVVEDDASIRTGLDRAFTTDGYDVSTAATLGETSQLTSHPDVVLLDANLPDGDGFDMCRALVAKFPLVRVLMLTARTSELDVVAGLDCGAADYVTKPFRLAELKARVRAQLRTATSNIGSLAHPEVFEVGDVRVDLDRRRVWLDDVEIELRAKEFDLLARLIREPGKVLTRDVLMHDVWDEHWYGSTKTLDVHGLRGWAPVLLLSRECSVQYGVLGSDDDQR